MRKSIKLVTAAFITMSLISLAQAKELASSVISVKDAYAVESPNAKDTEVFMMLTNTGKTSHHLIAVSSSSGARTQIHDTQLKKDKDPYNSANMVQLKEFTIKPGKTEIFKEGGKHVMLMDLNKPLVAGNNVDLILLFNDGSKEVLDVPVKAKNTTQ
jgi:copper(I)-binding protein